ncbi:MAG TPA: hypothetical protein VHS96_00985, partial [Bacteroidia bacterium]|nr:hypothetical protein [Bacteroidia bacterium]
LQQETTAAQLGLLADDILRYHGLGCRSVSCVLVPVGYPLHALCERLENAAPHSFAVTGKTVLRYERAQLAMSGAKIEPCQAIIVQHADQVGPGRLGVLNIVTYSDRVAADAMLAAAAADIQCIVGTEAVPFGQSQCPTLDDFADGVDTLAILTRL